MSKNYYQTLEISQDATALEIKKSYRRLALRFHPDVNQNDRKSAEYFKEITEAYGVLIDPVKRRMYDLQRIGRFNRDTVFRDIFSRSDFRDVFDGLPLKREWIDGILNVGMIFAYEALVVGGRPGDILKRGMIRVASNGVNKMFHTVMDMHENVSVPKEIAENGGYISLDYRPGFTLCRIRIKVPMNIRPGNILRIQGMGRRNFLKKRGDLYLHVVIEPS
jgi:DnaJ-class molecular chaperone